MTIPATHAEIEELYLNAELKQCRSICLTACNSGEGTTTLAKALTERYLLAGYKTLLVDLNMFRPSLVPLDFDMPSENSDTASQLLQEQDSDSSSPKVFLGVSVPSDPKTRLRFKDPIQLRKQTELWLEEYDRVVFDTSPILNVNQNNIPAQVVANACDGTFLVVLSGVTMTNQVTEATQILNAATSVQLLGSVLNYRDQPSLASEICREIDRLSWLPNRVTNWMKTKVRNNRFLSQSI
ncbi:chromosome partitioning protein ParA [Vibrio maritimus]|uniref:chromosome partitioning protein ParA n=1 Tax=Vibrio maritimus TaxID=990268 RepID=UPI0040692D7B